MDQLIIIRQKCEIEENYSIQAFVALKFVVGTILYISEGPCYRLDDITPDANREESRSYNGRIHCIWPLKTSCPMSARIREYDVSNRAHAINP